MRLESIRYWYLRRMVGTALLAAGLPATLRLTRRIAESVFALHTTGRRRAEARLTRALATASAPMNARDVAALVAAHYDHLARFWAEVLFARRLLPGRSWRRRVHTDKQTQAALRPTGRGCLLATVCYGNPAIAALALGRIYRPVHVLVDAVNQPYLRGWQRDLYADPWVRPIVRTDAVGRIPGVLREGGAILTLADHTRWSGRGVSTEFLGANLNCYPTLARLARWFDVPIIPITCRRTDEPFAFELRSHDVISPQEVETRDDAVIRRLMATLESAIRQDPAQFLWSVPITGKETESATSRTTRRTASASQRPSGAGSRPAGSVGITVPLPMA